MELTIKRSNSWFLKFASFQVYLNDELIGEIKSGKTFQLSVEIGDTLHIYQSGSKHGTKAWVIDAQTPSVLEVHPNATYQILSILVGPSLILPMVLKPWIGLYWSSGIAFGVILTLAIVLIKGKYNWLLLKTNQH